MGFGVFFLVLLSLVFFVVARAVMSMYPRGTCCFLDAALLNNMVVRIQMWHLTPHLRLKVFIYSQLCVRVCLFYVNFVWNGGEMDVGFWFLFSWVFSFLEDKEKRLERITLESSCSSHHIFCLILILLLLLLQWWHSQLQCGRHFHCLLVRIHDQRLITAVRPEM